jgi:hypothetical protein
MAHRCEILTEETSCANASMLIVSGQFNYTANRCQSDSTAFPSFLVTYATRLLAEPLKVYAWE